MPALRVRLPHSLTLSTLLLARLLRRRAMDMTVAFLCASLGGTISDAA
jgi:hypothetical protein